MGNVLNNRHIWNSDLIISVAGRDKNLKISPGWTQKSHTAIYRISTNGTIKISLSEKQEIMAETNFAASFFVQSLT